MPRIGTSVSIGATRTPPFQLEPPGNSTAQTIANFTGSNSGHLHSGHMIWLPDAFTVSGSTWNYEEHSEYPVIIMRGGTGSTPTSTFSSTLATFKAAMTAGTIVPSIIVSPSLIDPADEIEGWGMNCADGSFPLEDMMRLDLPAFLRNHTRAAATPATIVEIGFSKGGFEVLRMRAKFGSSHAAAFIVIDAPRLDADLGGAAASYATFTSNGTGGAGAQQAKLFGSNSAVCQAQSPFATTAGTGLFNVLGANAGGLGAAPLLMLRADPGGGSPATNAAAMNNAATRLTNASVTFTNVNLDNAGHTPSHNLGQFMAAWAAETTNGLAWIATNAAAF
jgi:hypothetical protein